MFSIFPYISNTVWINIDSVTINWYSVLPFYNVDLSRLSFADESRFFWCFHIFFRASYGLEFLRPVIGVRNTVYQSARIHKFFLLHLLTYLTKIRWSFLNMSTKNEIIILLNKYVRSKIPYRRPGLTIHSHKICGYMRIYFKNKLVAYGKYATKWLQHSWSTR